MDHADGAIIVYTTVSTEIDARALGTMFVDQGIAACVTIIPSAISLYRWQGQMETATEVVVLVKTRKSLEKTVVDALASRHPYAVPAILVFTPDTVFPQYMTWLLEQTRDAPTPL